MPPVAMPVALGSWPLQAPRLKLRNGFEMRVASLLDAKHIEREVFELHHYCQRGVSIQEGATVVDVGANIGLFSVYAAQRAGEQGQVLALEPLPEPYARLATNAAAFQHFCPGAAPILPLQLGAGDGSRSEAEFSYYPGISGWGSCYPDDAEVLANMEAFLANQLSADEGLGSAPLTWLGRTLREKAPPAFYEAVWRTAVRALLRTRVQRTCPLTTLSQLVEQHQLERIDLLKLDVERAELDALRGLRPEHWPRVRQLSAEVHAANVEACLALLRGPGGFLPEGTVVQQASGMEGTDLWMLYCTR